MEQVLVRESPITWTRSNSPCTGFLTNRESPRRYFPNLAEKSINVDMIIQNVSEDGFTNLSFTIATEDIEKT